MDEVYNVKDIMRILKIGRNRAYELMQSSGFPATKLGYTYFVTADNFKRWLDRYAGKEFEI